MKNARNQASTFLHHQRPHLAPKLPLAQTQFKDIHHPQVMTCLETISNHTPFSPHPPLLHPQWTQHSFQLSAKIRARLQLVPLVNPFQGFLKVSHWTNSDVMYHSQLNSSFPKRWMKHFPWTTMATLIVSVSHFYPCSTIPMDLISTCWWTMCRIMNFVEPSNG